MDFIHFHFVIPLRFKYAFIPSLHCALLKNSFSQKVFIIERIQTYLNFRKKSTNQKNHQDILQI